MNILTLCHTIHDAKLCFLVLLFCLIWALYLVCVTILSQRHIKHREQREYVITETHFKDNTAKINRVFQKQVPTSVASVMDLSLNIV